VAKGSTQTRTRIINVTRTLYSSHGCDGTTLDDIITASGVTKGAFYHYFKSKEILCHELIDQVWEEYRELIASLDPQVKPLSRLIELIKKLDDLNNSGEWINCRLILRLSADSHDSHPQLQKKIRNFWHWYIGVFTSLIESCQEDGQLEASPNAQTQAKMIMSMIAGTIIFDRITHQQEGFSDMVEKVLCRNA